MGRDILGLGAELAEPVHSEREGRTGNRYLKSVSMSGSTNVRDIVGPRSPWVIFRASLMRRRKSLTFGKRSRA